MVFGRRRWARRRASFVSASDPLRSPGLLFYAAHNRLFAENGLDPLDEKRFTPHCIEGMDRSGVPPGVLFRMLFVGCLEGLKSHRRDLLALRRQSIARRVPRPVVNRSKAE